MDPEPRRFPILNNPTIEYVPWAMLAPHEERAKRNHSQSLERLAERGGLDAGEAMCVLLDVGWGDYGSGWNGTDEERRASKVQATRDLLARMEAFADGSS